MDVILLFNPFQQRLHKSWGFEPLATHIIIKVKDKKYIQDFQQSEHLVHMPVWTIADILWKELSELTV